MVAFALSLGFWLPGLWALTIPDERQDGQPRAYKTRPVFSDDYHTHDQVDEVYRTEEFPSGDYRVSDVWSDGSPDEGSWTRRRHSPQFIPMNRRHGLLKSDTLDHGFFAGEPDNFHRSIRNYAKFDQLRVEDSLLEFNDSLSYELLSNTPHGRHLLLITLLEGFDKDCWKPRCMGYISYFLPSSLRSPKQPDYPPSVNTLRDCYLNGQRLSRRDIEDIYSRSPAARIIPGRTYSRFRSRDVAAVNALAEIALGFDSFDSLLSFLVVVREMCNRQVFIEVLYLIIQLRSDVGFVVPNLPSITPDTFFPRRAAEDFHQPRRSKSSMVDFHDDPWVESTRRDRLNPVRTFSYKTTHRTLPASDPESQFWYLREDIMANSMHGVWHVLVSDPNAPFITERRGELFYHMHKQMLNRYNADRLALGMKVVESLGMNEWGRPMMKGYNSLLGPEFLNAGNFYPPRGENKRFSDEAVERLKFGVNVIDYCIRRMVINETRLEYVNGVDYGVSKLGDLIEPYPDFHPEGLSLLHNYAHVEISMMSDNQTGEDSLGVMGFAETAMRDPVFWRWHKFTDDFFNKYKERLGPYPDHDLNCPGVEVVSVSATSGGKRNQLRTFTDFNTLELDSNLLRTMNGTILRYERLNHDPYLFTLRVHSTIEEWVVGRIFLIPSAKIWDHDMIDVVVEMDKFNIKLTRGMNVITRRSIDSPLMTPGAPSLRNLQEHLLRGMSETEFNWGNCGWPIELALPRGNAAGQKFELVVIFSKVHPNDQSKIVSWEEHYQTSWSWCGMRQGEGSMPDARPMGFPFDRRITLKKLMERRPNMKAASVYIRHTG